MTTKVEFNIDQPLRAAVARVVADMRKHQGHIQLGACIKGWCDALAAAPDSAELPQTPGDKYFIHKDGSASAVMHIGGPDGVVTIKAEDVYSPSPGTIAAADVVPVRDAIKLEAENAPFGVWANEGDVETLDKWVTDLTALIAAAGEGEPVKDWFICAECGRKHTMGEPLGPVVPLAVVDGWIDKLMTADREYATRLGQFNDAIGKYRLRPAAPEPCVTCGNTGFRDQRISDILCDCSAGQEIKRLRRETLYCPDCQPQEPPDMVECPACHETFKRGGPHLCITFDKTTPPLEPRHKVIVEPHTAILDSKLTTPPLTSAQRAAWLLSRIHAGVEKTIADVCVALMGGDDDHVLTWLQAPGDEEVERDE